MQADRVDRQAHWIGVLQKVLAEERDLLDQIAERLEDHDLDAEEIALLNQWRARRGLPAR